MQSLLIQFAQVIAQEPKTGDQPPRVFYVGGTVRDILRGVAFIDLHDIDVEVYGVAPERVQEILQTVLQKPVEIFGAMFGVYRVAFPEYEQSLDVAIPRTESKQGTGHRGFALTGNPHLSFVDALRRRDFTMNALLYDILTGEIIDPFHGQEDFQQSILRVVDAVTFGEDPLRVYRAMQFIARFALRVDDASMACMRTLAQSSEMQTLSRERITLEWKKMLEAPWMTGGLLFLQDVGLFPERISSDTLQVLKKTEGVSELELSLLSTVRLIALLAPRDAQAVAHFFAQFTFREEIALAVQAVLLWHPRLVEIFHHERRADESEAHTVNALRMMWRDGGFARHSFYEDALFAWCDLLASFSLPASPLRAFAESFLVRYAVRELACTPLMFGRDILAIAERMSIVPPAGKDLGDLLDTIERARDCGELVTKHDAVLFVEKYFTH